MAEETGKFWFASVGSSVISVIARASFSRFVPFAERGVGGGGEEKRRERFGVNRFQSGMFRSGNFIKGRPTLPCRRRFPIKRYISILHSRPSSSQPRCRPSFLSRDPRLRDTMEKFRTRGRDKVFGRGMLRDGSLLLFKFCIPWNRVTFNVYTESEIGEGS